MEAICYKRFSASATPTLSLLIKSVKFYGKIGAVIGKVTEERIRVRYGETDQMGHAYYANYLYWFEQARGAWCRAHGFTYKELEAMGYKLPVVEVFAKYRNEVRYDDEIIVRVSLEEVCRSSLRFAYTIWNESTNKLTTEGYTWHVLMGESRRAIAIPETVKALLMSEPKL